MTDTEPEQRSPSDKEGRPNDRSTGKKHERPTTVDKEGGEIDGSDVPDGD